MSLEELVERVSEFIMAHPNERDCWQKAPALSGILAWDKPRFRSEAKRWIDRAIATQKSDGNLSYADFHTSPGHVRSFTPIASETASIGVPVLDMFERTKEARYLESARLQYEALLAAPRTESGAIWSRGEGPEVWIDFTYLMCPFMVRYGIAANDPKAIDLAFEQFRVYVEPLLDSRKNLARHAWCEKPDHYPQSTFWARGNTWLLCACVELISLAGDHSGAAFVKEIYAKVITAMAAMQDRSGYFMHILDDPLSNLEASSTLMFAYAAERGVQLGIDVPSLGSSLRERGLKAFRVVAGSVEPSGLVPGVALVPGGPGVGFGWTLFGQGFFLLAAHALREQLKDFEA